MAAVTMGFGDPLSPFQSVNRILNYFFLCAHFFFFFDTMTFGAMTEWHTRPDVQSWWPDICLSIFQRKTWLFFFFSPGVVLFLSGEWCVCGWSLISSYVARFHMAFPTPCIWTQVRRWEKDLEEFVMDISLAQVLHHHHPLKYILSSYFDHVPVIVTPHRLRVQQACVCVCVFWGCCKSMSPL